MAIRWDDGGMGCDAIDDTLRTMMVQCDRWWYKAMIMGCVRWCGDGAMRSMTIRCDDTNRWWCDASEWYDRRCDWWCNGAGVWFDPTVDDDGAKANVEGDGHDYRGRSVPLLLMIGAMRHETIDQWWCHDDTIQWWWRHDRWCNDDTIERWWCDW